MMSDGKAKREERRVWDLAEEGRVVGEYGAGGDEPAVAEDALRHVVHGHAVHEERRVRCDLLQAPPDS